MVGNDLLPVLVLLFGLALLGVVLARRFDLPGLAGMLLVGVALKIGAVYWGVEVVPVELMNDLAKVGVTFLLFLLGVEFSLRSLGRLRKLCLLAAGVQVVLTALLGVFVLGLLGIGGTAGLVMALGLSFGSTAVVVKLLTERGGTQTVSGRILIGWLLVQDVAVIPIGVFLSWGSGGMSWKWLMVIMAGVVFLGVMARRIFDFLAKVGGREALILAAAVFGLGLGWLFERAGLSLVLGGFVAGVLLSESSEKHEIFAKLSSLRDLFAGVFFLSLGFLISPGDIFVYWKTILLLVGVIGLVKVILAVGELLFWKVHPRVAVGVGAGLFGAGEFAFVIGQIGFERGLLLSEHLTVLIGVVVISMILMPLLFGLEGFVYRGLRGILEKLGLNGHWMSGALVGNDGLRKLRQHVVLVGFGRVGKFIGERLGSGAKGKLVVVDYDLGVVERLREKGIKAVFGDILEEEVGQAVAIDKAGMVILTVPEADVARQAVRMIRRLNPGGFVLVRVHRRKEAEEIKEMGADRVVLVEESVGKLIYGYIRKRI